jgi:hypothetical protein
MFLSYPPHNRKTLRLFQRAPSQAWKGLQVQLCQMEQRSEHIHLNCHRNESGSNLHRNRSPKHCSGVLPIGAGWPEGAYRPAVIRLLCGRPGRNGNL